MHLVGRSVHGTVDDVLHDDAASGRDLLGLASSTSHELGGREAKNGVENSQPDFLKIIHKVLKLSEDRSW